MQTVSPALTETDRQTEAAGHWRRFCERLRIDMIEAQCAIESGQTVRASELIDGALRKMRRIAPTPESGDAVVRSRESNGRVSACRCP